MTRWFKDQPYAKAEAAADSRCAMAAIWWSIPWKMQ
jgi:hypothetical protein